VFYEFRSAKRHLVFHVVLFPLENTFFLPGQQTPFIDDEVGLSQKSNVLSFPETLAKIEVPDNKYMGSACEIMGHSARAN